MAIELGSAGDVSEYHAQSLLTVKSLADHQFTKNWQTKTCSQHPHQSHSFFTDVRSQRHSLGIITVNVIIIHKAIIHHGPIPQA
jgi:hypothetical protein